MQIGKFAAIAGVSIQAVRFYERKRLLTRPRRTSAGYRDFTESDAAVLKAIKDAQALGFTLKEIRTLIDLHKAWGGTGAGGGKPPARMAYAALEVVRLKLRSVDAQIVSLRAVRKQLSQMAKQLGSAEDTCPVAGPESGRAVRKA
jgi:DNA-binding transcriptional MerR regulator